ncbi:MAG: PrsW family intramembrane metalloprotease [Stackebrandtia sp.]
MTAVPPPSPPASGPPAGGYAPPPVSGRFPWRRFLTLAGMILLLAAGAIFMLWITGTSLGFTAAAVGVAAAVLPVPLLVACFLWLGRHNRTPLSYLAFSFAWGACVSTSVSLAVNTFAAARLADLDWDGASPSEQFEWPELITAVGVAPIVEEVTKFLGPLLLLLWMRRRRLVNFTEIVVYFGLSALGFAMTENILYLGRGYVEGSDGLGAAGGALIAASTFVMRILISGFAHPLFTMMSAVGVAVALRRTPGVGRVFIPLGMLLAAMVLHSAWNLLASFGPVVLISGYLAVMVPIFFTAVGGALWARAAEARLAVRTLSDYVDAGWLSPPEIAALATYRRRTASKVWAKRVAGDAGAKAMRDYQRLATQLALLRDHMRRGVADPDHGPRELEMLQGLTVCRQVFCGADPAMPRATWDGRYYQVQFPDGSVRQVNPPPQPVMPLPIPARPPQPVGPPMPPWAGPPAYRQPPPPPPYM